MARLLEHRRRQRADAAALGGVGSDRRRPGGRLHGLRDAGRDPAPQPGAGAGPGRRARPHPRPRPRSPRGPGGRRGGRGEDPALVGPVVSAFPLTAARAEIVRRAHGDVPTPAFMPVGTKGTVKTVDPDELTALGTTILLGNAYHLHFRPGDELIAELGGLHRFMGWAGAILTDSGGFQIFSLRDTLLDMDDEGVTFRSVYDGSSARVSALDSARIQANLGSDIAMCLDICLPAGVARRELEDAVRRTTLWAREQRGAPRSAGQLRFGIAQGGADAELRRRSIEEIAELDF